MLFIIFMASTFKPLNGFQRNEGVAPQNTGGAGLFAAIFFCRNTGQKKDLRFNP